MLRTITKIAMPARHHASKQFKKSIGTAQQPRWNYFLGTTTNTTTFLQEKLLQPTSTKRFISTTNIKHEQEESGLYPGNVTVPYVSEIDFVKPEAMDIWPAFRILNNDGSVREGATDPDLPKDVVINMYTVMARLATMDKVFYDAQRQGRISFYMTSGGEGGIHVGSAAGLSDDDMIYAQYREAGVLMWRGFTLQQFADQCFSNVGDPAKGRQMPVHYGSVKYNFQTISSPLTTQLPQAAGASYAFKNAKLDRIVACYFGDGAASEGDFHPALNFAATRECPIVFFCRNNGFAISTPVKDQYRGDGIASRGIGYGMATIRVDGNDVFAVHEVTKEARRIALEEQRPVLIEAMTYRQGHHSTSDDSTRYREVDEIKSWKETDDPQRRLRGYMEEKGWWSDKEEEKLMKEEREAVLKALNAAETKPTAEMDELFTDVYDEKPQQLLDQEKELHEHIQKYPDQYKVGGHH